MKEKVVIKLNELPPRSEKLSIDEMANVFGGCLADGQSCQKSSGECCNYCITLFSDKGTCGTGDSGP